jgi:hypothetical protein
MNRITLFILALFLLKPIPAFCVFEVDPSVEKITAPKGGSFGGKVVIKNNSDGQLKMTGKVMDWKYEKNDGSKKLSPAGSSDFSCSKWLTYSPVSFELDPGKTQEVSYSISIPSAASGGFYSILMYSATTPAKKETAQGINIAVSLQMGTLLMVEVDKTQVVQGKLSDLKIVSAVADGPLEVSVKFKNMGNVRTEAKGSLSIMDSEGGAVGWTKFPPCKTLPGDEWTLTASWSGLTAGKYHLVATFELAPGKVIVEENDVEVR